ncbi:MAG TPA: methyltransferase domain-containing protein [Candidatus Binataceae bacterium]|nr:methyltransferase domain-containing protein [Candidatus Binataceae bacterium]
MPEDFPSEFFRRIDESDDELFYTQPRFVVHIDDGAIAKAGEIYARLLPQGGTILDLMSSWRSHLPAHVRPSRLVGLGMNRAEMEDNPALNEVVVHNLNQNPELPFAENEFDGAIVTVSIQYMTRPLEIFRGVAKVLKPDAPFIVTFSNRMFPTKAVAIWHSLDEFDRVRLVWRYFQQSGGFENMEAIDVSAPTDPPTDPIWAVVGYRKREAIE